MTIRLHDMIDTHNDFIAPESIDHILGRYLEMICNEDLWDQWDFRQGERMSRAVLNGAETPLFAGILHTLQSSADDLLRDYYEDHFSVLSKASFNPELMRYVDPYNVTLNQIHPGKSFRCSMCSANHPAFFHYQLTGRIILSNSERRRMTFFFEPNSYSVSLPEGALIIHPSNMLYPHTVDVNEGELIYLEFNLCPELKRRKDE